MGAALVRVDRVGEGVHRLAVAGVPLHGDLDLDAVALGVEGDHALVHRLTGGVDVPDEVLQPTRITEGALPGLARVRVLLALGQPLIPQGDGQSLVQESHLLQPAGHRLRPLTWVPHPGRR